jgi:hypothetical protein
VAVVVCGLLVLLVVHLLQHTAAPPQARGDASSPGPGASRSAGPSPTPDATPTGFIPSSFAGTWSGRVSQPDDSYTVTVGLASGAKSGTIRYSSSSLSCSGALTVTGKASGHLTLSQQITKGPCLPGTVTLTLAAASSIRFSFDGSGPQAPQANGTLSKS